MRTCLLRCVAIVAVMAGAGVASAQSVVASDYKPPRTSWGAPELSGFWTNGSLTTLQRPAGATSVTVTETEAASLLRKNVYTLLAKDEEGASKLDRESTDKLLADGNSNRGYNSFWIDPGSAYARVGDDIRTAWITAPADGMIPYKPGARKMTRRSYDGPEARPLMERCVSAARAGPVFGNGMYNNIFQLVQTPTHLMIDAEMIHETRIVPIVKSASEAKHGPDVLMNYGGDSVAWYEGDTLVVQTVNVRQDERAYISASGKTTERFTRWTDNEILYEFRVEDPSLYTQPWSGEQVLRVSSEPLYEFACHEGNYGMHGILAGARQLERDGREHPPEISIFAGLEAEE